MPKCKPNRYELMRIDGCSASLRCRLAVRTVVCRSNLCSARSQEKKIEKCIRKTVEISAPCTKCFSEAGQYGYKKCKRQCLVGKWCSQRCLGCTAKHDAHTEACVGVDVPKPDVC